jgi:AcrR family transcriptional regulator
MIRTGQSHRKTRTVDFPTGRMEDVVKEAAEVTRDPRPAAQRVRDAAKELFYRQGIRATGVDEVCRVAGATKMSLYRAYPSKDALVAAILKEDCAEYERWYRPVAEAPPAERPRAFVAAAVGLLREPGFRGCPMGLAIAEFPDPDHPARKVADAHKRAQRADLQRMCAAAGARSPEVLGDALMLVLEGAFSIAPSLGNGEAALALERAAEALFVAAGLHAPA